MINFRELTDDAIRLGYDALSTGSYRRFGEIYCPHFVFDFSENCFKMSGRNFEFHKVTPTDILFFYYFMHAQLLQEILHAPWLLPILLYIILL